MSSYVELGYHDIGYLEGDDISSVNIDVSGATKFFIKDTSDRSKESIIFIVSEKLKELEKDIALVSDFRDGTSYVVITESKRAELTSGRQFVDVSSGGALLEVIEIGE